MDEYAAVLDRVAARMHQNGEISSTYAELPFDRRTIAITREAGLLNPQPFDITIPINTAHLHPDTEYHFGPAVFALLRSERLLDAVESLIGPEITSNPVQHVRIKPPERYVTERANTGLVTTTGWHQDNGVVHEEADDTDMLTVWLALTEATERNGCMMVVPGSYHEGLQLHCTLPNERGAEGHYHPHATDPQRARAAAADVARRRAVHAPPLHARLADQPQRRRALELRPALQPNRPVHRPHLSPQLRGAQPCEPGVGVARRRSLGTVVGGHPPPADVG